MNGVLSGPAGGVVGLAAIAGSAGLGRLIGFDMGGTSTDVSLYAGELPRRLGTEIDGVRLHAPMMDVHTIAAGGGSIVQYADGRLQVGPESAGADPGPACYRRGGPATVTDCNVVLGRIRPERFPRVFGASGDEPLDVGRIARAPRRHCRGQSRDDGTRLGVEQLAEAFLTVAVARMANAIRELALGQGHDPAQFSLLPFGGAAGQHACAVAECARHPLDAARPAGRRAFGVRHRARPSPLREAPERDRALRCSRRRARGRDPRVARGRRQAASSAARAFRDAAMRLRRTASLRFAGSDSEIEVAWDTPAAMRAEFEAAHRRLYGFADDTGSVVIAGCCAEAIERDSPADDDARGQRPRPRGVARRRVRHGDSRRKPGPAERGARSRCTRARTSRQARCSRALRCSPSMAPPCGSRRAGSRARTATAACGSRASASA